VRETGGKTEGTENDLKQESHEKRGCKKRPPAGESARRTGEQKKNRRSKKRGGIRKVGLENAEPFKPGGRLFKTRRIQSGGHRGSREKGRSPEENRGGKRRVHLEERMGRNHQREE